MVKVNRLFLMLLFCLFNFLLQEVQGQQIKNESSRFLLDGYFLIYRKTISMSDQDHIPNRLSYMCFFVKDLNEDVINNYRDLDSLQSDILDVYRNPTEPFWGFDKQKDSIERLFSKEDLYGINIISGIFEWEKKVPSNIINGNDRFLVVYKGQLNTVGPFVVISKLIRRESSGFIYLKSALNRVEYLYTIILPTLSEEKMYYLPFALK